MGLVHYDRSMRTNWEKRTLCIQITYAEITHFMQKISVRPHAVSEMKQQIKRESAS